MGWNGAGASVIASHERAGHLLAYVLDHEPTGRHSLEALGHHLAQLAQTAATARASTGCRINHARARPVLGKRTAGRLASGKPTDFGCPAGIGRLDGPCGRGGLLQVLQRELKLLEPGAALGGGSEPLPPEAGNLQLQALNLDVEHAAGGLRGLCLSFGGDPGRALGQDHRLSAGEVGRKLTEGVRHP
jgi:hypothetical protein